MSFFAERAYAQSGAGGGGDSWVVSILPLVAIFAVFYLLLIRPQQKRAKAHRTMIANVQRGDEIITSGGIVGKVHRADETECVVEIAPNVRVRVLRGMISGLRASGSPDPVAPPQPPQPPQPPSTPKT